LVNKIYKGCYINTPLNKILEIKNERGDEMPTKNIKVIVGS